MRIISPPLLAVAAFSESLSPEMKETVFQEFNSFSVIFQVGSWAGSALKDADTTCR